MKKAIFYYDLIVFTGLYWMWKNHKMVGGAGIEPATTAV